VSLPLTWRLKRRFWTRWQLLRFKLAKPQQIGAPGPTGSPLAVAPLGEIYPKIPLREVVAVEQMPKEESPLPMRLLVNAGLVLARWCPSMRPGLPEIDADASTALEEAGIDRYAKAFRMPVRPAVYPAGGPTDLERLAVASPYAVLTERDADGVVQWDFRRLADFEHHDGLCSLGVRVVFSEAAGGERLSVDRIESEEVGVVTPADNEWARATSLAVCAATTHLALARHFLAVHLISGDHWDVAARNRLPADHPMYRLLWPHIFNSFYTNYGVTRVQMLPDGDFVNMFSFTHDGLIAYFDAMYRSYDVAVIEPVADWSRRGLGHEAFDCPTQTNLIELFDVMHRHASRYLDAYYEHDGELRADSAVVAWLSELDGLVPNGLGEVAADPTKDGLSRLIAGYIHEGSVIHDMVGTTLWDYQLWADHNPTRVHRDGRRIPVDVLQRTINNNFALQIRRAPLLDDYGEVALDDRAATLFTAFHEDCRALQSTYDATPAGPWRMEPKNLEINMNG
jgi:hypothetical protein